MKRILLLSCLTMSLSAAIAQTDGVLIDYTGATRDNSAVLEATSTQQGVLVPRMTSGQRDLIATPAHSLLIYQTDNTPGYYFNSGTPGSPVWQRLFSGSGSPVTGSGAATRVAFWDAANSLSSNANLYWDNTFDRLGIGTAAPGSKLEVVGDALTLSGANLDMNRDGYPRSGISWYSKTYPSWSTYMAQAGQTSVGPHGDLTAPSGTYVNSWALRSYIENVGGYGWTFESAANTTTPAVRFEIRASDGLFHAYGAGVIDGTLTIGGGSPAANRVLVSSNAAGLATWADQSTLAANYANLTGIPIRTSWVGVHRNFVAEQLSWKNYGNNHTIFDASAGTSPQGTAVNNTDAQIPWSATYPTLMGWNGANTYGVRVDQARVSDNTTGNSATVGGLPAGSFMQYQGFTLDANTMTPNRSGFTYSVNAPHTGPIVHFDASNYGLQINSRYHTGGNLISYRTRNGDIATWNPWIDFITTANIGGNSILNQNSVVQGANFIISATGRADGDFRAPIFYDQNNTAFYTDPNGTSLLNKLRIDPQGNLSGHWGHDPYGQGWGAPHASFRSLEVSSSGNFSTEPALFRIHQWGSGAAEFWKPQGTQLYLRETPGGGGGWFTRFVVQGKQLVHRGAIPNGWDQLDWGSTVSFRSPGTNVMANASHGNSQLELVSDGPGTAHISFHRPGLYGANFGLDSDNWFSTQGWSAGGGYTSMRVGSFVANGTGTVTGNFYAPIFYDSNNNGFYVDPNGTSEMNQLTLATRARWGKSRIWTNRTAYTGDQNYWTGTNGWSTSEGTWANAWKYGFGGVDIWGNGTDHPQGAGYIHAQGIVSGQHYASADGGSAYGWMMVGAHNATENRYWLRGKWGGSLSGWVEMLTTGNIASYGDNLGNHTATTTLNMNWNHINNVADIYAVNNYGQGLVGVYASTVYQNVFAMGTSWRLPANGSTPGNLYGLAWTHTNVGGQSKPGLSHQLLVMENGITKVALGTGIWMQGNLTFNSANPYINAPSYYVAPGGAYFNSGTVYTEATIQARGGIANDAGSYSGRVRIIDDLWATGWLRTDGAQGWYSETYGGGWHMSDATWLRAYGSKPIVFGAGAFANAASYGGYITANSVSDGHRLLGGGNSTTGWGYVGTSGNDWYYVYSDNFINSSVRAKKKDITPLDDNMMAYVMNDIDKIKPTFYRYKSETEEMVPGFETKYRPNMHLGVILDETPDYLQDQAFSGIDLYSMGVFALTGVKYQQKQIKALQKQVNGNMAVGKSTMSSTTLTVELPEGFCNDGEMPVINITPTSMSSGYYLSSSDSRSFTVTANSPFSFNWQAVRISTNEAEEPIVIDEELKSQLVVDQSKKDRIQEYWKKENEKVKTSKQKDLDALKDSDPVQYARIMEEDRLAEELYRSEGKSSGYDVAAMQRKTDEEVQRRMEEMSKGKESKDVDPNAPSLEKFPVTPPVIENAPAAPDDIRN